MITPTDHDRLRCAALHSYMDLRAAAASLRRCRPLAAWRLLQSSYHRLGQALAPSRPTDPRRPSHGR